MLVAGQARNLVSLVMNSRSLMIVKDTHKEILETIKKRSDGQREGDNYEGHSHLGYKISKPEERRIAKEFLKKYSDITQEEFVCLLNFLYSSNSSNEKYVASLLLENKGSFRKKIDLNLIDDWLDHLEGWAEIDCLCQSNFSVKEVLSRWDEWEVLIRDLNESNNVSKRRASLVLLIKTVRGSEDDRPFSLVLEMVDNVKDEKDKLITKAVSWVLRESIKNHRNEIENYLNENEDSLPAVAVRETRNKLRTGRK